MKYIKKFQTTTECEQYASDNTHIVPNVFMASDDKKIIRRKKRVVPSNTIYYTSTDGKVITPYRTSGFNCNIVSNTYENGEGVIVFDGILTTIGDYAFNNKTTLKTISLPNSVTTIKYHAFYYCSNLTDVILSDSLTTIERYTFNRCSKLKNIKLPNTLTTLGDNAFYYCSELKEINIPGSVAKVDYYTFYNCQKLENIIINNGVKTIGSNSFYRCNFKNIILPDSIESIDSYAFSTCSNLETIYLGKNLKTIGDNAFISCTKLKHITIPNSVTSIGERVFYGCNSLNGIYGKYASHDNTSLIVNNTLNLVLNKHTIYEIPSNVTSIGPCAFYGCHNLNKVIMHDNVTEIGEQAFYNCSNLTEINIPNGIEFIESSTFMSCSSLRSITIPDSVTIIGSYAFEGCSNLKDVYIGKNIEYIETGAFYHSEEEIYDEETGDYYITYGPSRNVYITDLTKWCNIEFTDNGDEYDVTCNPLYNYGTLYLNGTKVTNLVIPQNVTNIGVFQFIQCDSIESVTISENVSNIGYYAFYDCRNLSTVICKPTTPPYQYYSFDGTSSTMKIYVPYDSSSNYKSSWGQYSNKIEPSYTPSVCTNLVITAEDVNGRKTTTNVSYTATTNGYDSITNENKTGVIITGTGISSEFAQNTSTTDSVQRTVSFTYLGQTATTTITQGVWVDQEYKVVLNNQWCTLSSISNPSTSEYDGYESFSNSYDEDGENDTYATMYIDIDGYTNFKFYINSYSESCYDFVTVSNLDEDIPTYDFEEGCEEDYGVKSSTKCRDYEGCDIESYKLVEFNNIDGGNHRITIVYKKDISVSEGNDQGYVLIPKNQ